VPAHCVVSWRGSPLISLTSYEATQDWVGLVVSDGCAVCAVLRCGLVLVVWCFILLFFFSLFDLDLNAQTWLVAAGSRRPPPHPYFVYKVSNGRFLVLSFIRRELCSIAAVAHVRLARMGGVSLCWMDRWVYCSRPEFLVFFFFFASIFSLGSGTQRPTLARRHRVIRCGLPPHLYLWGPKYSADGFLLPVHCVVSWRGSPLIAQSMKNGTQDWVGLVMSDGCAIFRSVVGVLVVFFFFLSFFFFFSFGYGSRSQRQPTRAQSPFRWLFIRRRPHPINLAHKVISRRFLCTRGSPLFFSFKFQLRVRVGLFISDAWVPFAVRRALLAVFFSL